MDTPHPFRPGLQLPNMLGLPSQLDEGYSEELDTRSQSDNDMLFSDSGTGLQAVLRLAMALPGEERKLLIQHMVTMIDNKDKLEIKGLIEYLTHFDPATYLPPEIFLTIFSYLDPRDLLSVSLVSRAWRIRSQDEKLWRGCFAREGWVLDPQRLLEVEKLAERRGKRITERLLRGDDVTAPSLERRESRKRRRGEAFSDAESSVAPAAFGLDGAVDGAGQIEVDENAHESGSDDMEGIESTPSHAGTIRATSSTVPGTTISASEALTSTERRPSIDSVTLSENPTSASPTDLTLSPPIFQTNTNKLSWPYLFKQRRRLERNWETGQYSMFQLPHPSHPEEGHAECVYTIQHTSRHLVSGSRDMSIRIWDLATGRLKGKPLLGHEASVLCLQFDEREEQDIIVSGGSDSFVIIWKFSTGEIVKQLKNAHDESVLNLRFDERYIVTCSKDKTIKIWNRHALARDSDLIPTMTLPDFTDPSNHLGGDAALIEPFTLLAMLKNHHAAINAVVIHNSTIVSASGDRTIKAWDLRTGIVKKSYTGHTKGIACVQFDGRRIVSGSSDNTIRIFDAGNQAEVACLAGPMGHSNLVRTVQARFGDLAITSDAELEEEARLADRNFYRALSQGMQPAPVHRRALRNAGSSRPEDMLALGARVPPGGGGSRWAKIVSGSYDENIILWKRDPADGGKWVPRLWLHQGELLRPARRRGQQALVPPPTGPQAVGAGAGVQAGGALLSAAQTGLAGAQGHLQHLHSFQQQQQQQQGGTTTTSTTSTNTQTNVQTNMQLAQPPPPPPPLVQAQAQLAQVNAMLQPPATQQTQQTQQNQNQNAAGQHGNITTNTTTTSNPIGAAGGAHGANPTNAAHHGATAIDAGGIPGNNNPPAPAPGRGESMRVFKLQFDARRIICCSQQRTIVGWDFANGDKELERLGEWTLETA